MRAVRRTPIPYKMLPSQEKFHDCKVRFKGFSGPIGSGKSMALCQEVVRLCHDNPGRTGLVGAPTYPMLRDSTLAALMEVFNDSNIPYELNRSEFVLTLKDSGSRILLRSVDEFERLRGTNLAWFGIDELTYAPEGAWLRLEGRLRDPKAKRLSGFAVWTPKGFDWVYRKFIANPGAAYSVVLAKPFENQHVLSRVPDFYERLRSSYDENFYRQEVLGDYLNSRGGMVYSAFGRDVNVAAQEIDPALPIFWALDFNVDPMCSVVVQIHRGEVRVLDEIVLGRATTEDACLEFEKRFGLPGAGIVIYGDASGAAMHTSGYTDYSIIGTFFRARGAKHSMKVPKANPAVRDRVNLVNAKLRSANGETALVIDPKCRELIADLEQVAYKENSLAIDKEKDRRRTHLSDALGYLVWQEHETVRFGERNRRLF